MKPDRDTLYDLYCNQRLTTRSIGEIYGVGHTTIRKWLANENIPMRSNGRGLLSRGIEPPTCEELHQAIYVEQLSYAQAGKRFGIDKTAIPYWLDKYGIPRPTSRWEAQHQRKIAIPPAETLQTLYDQGLSLGQIGQQMGSNASAVHDWFKILGIQSRPGGWDGGKRLLCDDGHEVRSTYELKVDNWLNEHQIPHVYEPQLPFDRRCQADFSANGWFIEIWGVQHSESYLRRKNRKLALYTAYHCPLIQLPHWTFDSQKRGLWKRRLRRCLTAPQPELVLAIPPPLP